MIDPLKWKLHEFHPVMTWPTGAIEDLCVFERPDGCFDAYFSAGRDFLHQQIYKATAKSPYGPFTEDVHPIGGARTHSRIERGRIDERRSIVMTVWPGLPKCGLYLFEEAAPQPNFVIRSILLPPQAPFDVVAGNPCVIADREEGDWVIFFEGRGAVLHGFPDWCVYQAVWDGDPAHLAEPHLGPITVGANPFCARFGDFYYLYVSRKAPTGGFETWCLTQEAR